MRKKNFLDDLTSHTFMREKVIVADIGKNLNAISIDDLAFTGAVKSNTKFFTAENKGSTKNL